MKKFAMIAICAAVLLSVASCNTNNDSQGTSTDRGYDNLCCDQEGRPRHQERSVHEGGSHF